MRLIDAEALEEDFYDNYDKKGYRNGKSLIYAAWCLLKKLIEKAPTIEAKPVVYAHWINYNDMFPCQCSNCNGFALSFDIDNYRKEIKSDFCPHCGAQMDEVAE